MLVILKTETNTFSPLLLIFFFLSVRLWFLSSFATMKIFRPNGLAKCKESDNTDEDWEEQEHLSHYR